jgi:hypothetical protein
MSGKRILNAFFVLVFLFMPPRSKMGWGGGHIVFVLSVILFLSFCCPLKNSNFGYNFLMVSTRALISHMRIPCDKIYPWIPKSLTLCP